MCKLSCILIPLLVMLSSAEQAYSQHPVVAKESGICRTTTTFQVYDCWWEDSLDKGCDGYTQFRRLWVDVDVDDGSTRNVYLTIYTKAASSMFWVQYCTTSTFTITGNSAADWFWLSIGSPNPELSRDSYDFIVVAYEAGGTTSLASRGPENDADLQAQQFETAAEDIAGCPYAFGDCVWVHTLDANGDGYAEYGELWVDVRRQFGGTHTAYLKVYCRAAGTSTYELCATTPAYPLFALQNFLAIEIGGPNRELARGIYDLKVDLWVGGNFQAVLTRLPEDDPDLRNQRFEPGVANGVWQEELYPSKFRLEQNHPNPFNPTTVVSCQLPMASRLRIAVYDILGREVAVLMDERKEPGRFETTWDAGSNASGVYICRMTAGDFTETRKMILAR